MSLTSSLTIAAQSLSNATAVLQSINNNIANANTPGYSREVAQFQSTAPDQSAGLQPGDGAILQGFQSVRDELLQTQIQNETQAQGQANAALTSLQQIQPLFTTSTGDIGTEMSNFFSTMSSLSAQPDNSSARQAVMTAGQNLTYAFNTVSQHLTQLQSGLNTQVTQDVSQINQITAQIAALNPQIAALQSQGKDPGTLEDQRDQLVVQLSGLAGVSVTNTEGGITVSIGNGTPLVVGSKSFALQSGAGTGGMQQVLDANGNVIDPPPQGGDLGGTLQARDTSIPAVLNGLDTLAYQFATAFNAAQASGFDQNGNTGQPFFSIPPTSSGAAGSISVAISDPALIAASSDGSPGSNGNVANLTAVQTTVLPSGQTPTDAYANLVFQVGSMAAEANTQSSATAASLRQLKDQLSSVSGVSIDQETTNLITYQQAYEAAARVITTVQSLFQVTMTMGTAAAQ